MQPSLKTAVNTQRTLQYIDVLIEMEDESRSVSELTAACSPSRSTVRGFIRDCEDWSLVRHVNDDYTLTTAGNLVVREYNDLDGEHQAGLRYLANSPAALSLLRTIESHPIDKADLAKEANKSRTTVHKHLDNFQTSDWTKNPNKNIRLDSLGGNILESQRKFQSKMRTIGEKTQFLKRYGNNDFGVRIPLEALAESRQVVSTMTDKQKVVREVDDMDIDGTGPFRALSHSFSAQLSDGSYSDLTKDMDTELIVDRSVYAAITNPRRWKYLFRGFQYPNFQLLVHPKDLTVALGVYGEQEAVIATHSDRHPLDVGLFSSSEEFIEWIWKLYENYRSQASSPGYDLVRWATSR
jgi:predicted transcriptional regulator